jgi:hypothetical protein
LKGQGFGTRSLTLNGAGEMSADLAGLVFQRTTDPVLTPTYDAGTVPHFRRADIALTWLTGSGESDDFNISITNPLEPRDTFGSTLRSFFPDKMFHGNERVYVQGSIPKYSLDPDDIDALLNASTFAATAKWKSDAAVAATGKKYGMWMEMPACQYVAGTTDELGNRRRYGGSFDWFAAWSEGSAYDCKITLVNAIAAVESFV